MQQRRRMLVDHYRERLGDLDGVSCVPTEQHLGSADHLMVVKLPRHLNRECVIHHMATKGIGTSVHFQRLSEFAWFQDNAHVGPGGTPAADSLSRRVLSLPLHPQLRRRDVDRVVDELGHALG
jgi:dTDP-4-amino-4,6-dideoxygalactose transaminase